jgi:hypothetical protein
MNHLNVDLYEKLIDNIFLQSISFTDFCNQVYNLYGAVKSFDLDKTITKYKTKYFSQIRNSLIDDQENLEINLETVGGKVSVEIHFEYDDIDIDTLTEKVSWENKVAFLKQVNKIRNIYKDVDIDIDILFYDPEFDCLLKSSSTLKKNENKMKFDGNGAYIYDYITEEAQANATPIWFYETIRFSIR